ncbi:hypothetical protein [Thalassotalea aquiviva]|uniref:hypothetical protein n=1 Tax=Thalassotalea aquiviva TaxID=3242415 RepID=UPI00352A0E28
MGRNVSKVEYNADDFKKFEQALYAQLEQFKSILKQPTFGQGELKLGAELELYLVNDQGQASLSNQSLLERLNDPQFQPELNQYNLELNLSAVPATGAPFSALKAEMDRKIAQLRNTADQQNVNVIPIGILPTLDTRHLSKTCMTDLPRYHSLANHLYQHNPSGFHINIDGEEPVDFVVNDICAEGANTSFQVHMMTPFEQFCHTFNAAQLTLPLVTAIGANSPILLGNRLWDETRIALFKQSLDIRNRFDANLPQPTRVSFGFGWLRHSVWELFAEAVALHKPILADLGQPYNGTGLPKLEALNLHIGTLWPWHRPVYDHHGKGHVRIEFRAIPAGPTHVDMLANAAFAIGLAQGMSDHVEDYLAMMPFRFAEYNFYRSAQFGLDANILWPLLNKYKPEPTPIVDVIAHFIPLAKQGLEKMGVNRLEIDLYIGIIESRLEQRITGAIWQKKTLTEFEQHLHKASACQKMLSLYLANSMSGMPVSKWRKPWQ